MLFFSLILSALLLLLSNWIVRRSQHPSGLITILCLVSLLTPLLAFCVAPAAMIQSLFLLIAAFLWRQSGRGPSEFLRYSLGATAAAYGVAGVLVFLSEREYARLRRLYPYESIEERVPMAVSSSPPSVSSTSNSRLDRIEGRLGGWSWFRARQLRILHEDAVGLFVNSPGFGISRMGLPSASMLATREEGTVPRQPGTALRINWSPGDVSLMPSTLSEPADGLLDASILDFVNERGFGYVKDRRHVAGFEAHRFQRSPGGVGNLNLQRLELVSLLLHDPPIVYDSAELPRMDRVRETPTRETDRFERYGLESLREGEDLVFSETRDGARLLGAIRSVKQCIDCHGGQRGELLGAFSYVLGP
jgi:hypothetical protein